MQKYSSVIEHGLQTFFEYCYIAGCTEYLGSFLYLWLN